MDDGVWHLSARRAQGIIGRREVEATAPLAQLVAGLVIKLIGHQRLAEAVVTVVPGVDLLLQCGDLGLGTFNRPVGTGRSNRGNSDEDETGEGMQVRWHRSILAWLSTSRLVSVLIVARPGALPDFAASDG